MSWVRLEDIYPINRKVGVLSDGAFRLDVEAICWSARETADGVIRAHELVLIRARATKKQAAELVARGRWHVAGAECPSPKCPPAGPDGWVIHDYLDYQPTRETVIKDREARAERMRRWRNGKAGGKPATEPSRNGVTSGSSNSASALSPPRPAPKEGGGGAPAAPTGRRSAAGRAAGGEQRQTLDHSPKCPTCGNGVDSTYHRNVCAKIGAA
jgi:hypothetical protein